MGGEFRPFGTESSGRIPGPWGPESYLIPSPRAGDICCRRAG